ncbi:MAG: hypothetical protein ACPGWR_02930, partial [Ardenticatenaceae bacterium]
GMHSGVGLEICGGGACRWLFGSYRGYAFSHYMARLSLSWIKILRVALQSIDLAKSSASSVIEFFREVFVVESKGGVRWVAGTQKRAWDLLRLLHITP